MKFLFLIPFILFSESCIIRPFPSFLYYKPFGASKFSPNDPRKNKATVVFRYNKHIRSYPRCLKLLDPSKEPLIGISFHSKKGIWIARYYAHKTCFGLPSDGCSLFSKLKDRGFTEPLAYVKIAGFCYPINVTKCGSTSTDIRCKKPYKC